MPNSPVLAAGQEAQQPIPAALDSLEHAITGLEVAMRGLAKATMPYRLQDPPEVVQNREAPRDVSSPVRDRLHILIERVGTLTATCNRLAGGME